MKKKLQISASRVGRIAASLFGSACLLASHVHAGTVTTSTAAEAFASIDSSTQTYSHAFTFNAWPGQVITTGGVTFTPVGGATGSSWPYVASGTVGSPAGWVSDANVHPALSVSTETKIQAGQGANSGTEFERFIASRFQTSLVWNSTNSFTTEFSLSGLEAGVEYTLTLYYSLKMNTNFNTTIEFTANGETSSAQRLANSTSSDHADLNSVSYTYIAGDNGTVNLKITENAASGTGDLRLYGLTNYSNIPEPASWGALIGVLALFGCVFGRQFARGQR